MDQGEHEGASEPSEPGADHRPADRADTLHRCIARALDFLIVATLYQAPLATGAYVGMAYLLIADGFSGGRSVGKRLIGLQVVRRDGRVASFRESMLRNAPFAVAYFFLWVPWGGMALFCLVVGLEWLLIVGNREGARVGDELAKTRVLASTPT